MAECERNTTSSVVALAFGELGNDDRCFSMTRTHRLGPGWPKIIGMFTEIFSVTLT